MSAHPAPSSSSASVPRGAHGAPGVPSTSTTPATPMTRARFAEYRRQATEYAQGMYQGGNQKDLYEQAVPSYIHGNPLLRALFWERMWQVVHYVERANQERGPVLDFGCGVGILLPLLAACGFPVAAVDVDIVATPKFLERFGVNAMFVDQPERLDALPDGSFSVITALDVLEHFPDTSTHLTRLRRLLAPGGCLVICGPTENLIYKLGRKVAGFSGHYHVQNIYDIRRSAQPLFALEHVSTLLPLVPLFEIFACIRRA